MPAMKRSPQSLVVQRPRCGSARLMCRSSRRVGELRVRYVRCDRCGQTAKIILT